MTRLDIAVRSTSRTSGIAMAAAVLPLLVSVPANTSAQEPETVSGGGGLELAIYEAGNPETVLVVQGAEDRIVRPSSAEYIAGVVPGADVRVYEGVGHAPFLEDPERFDRELAEFVRSARPE